MGALRHAWIDLAFRSCRQSSQGGVPWLVDVSRVLAFSNSSPRCPIRAIVPPRQDDSAYQANQAKAQRAWSQRNPDYWKQYREAHPEYAERNRQQQQKRNLERRSGNIAKKNVSPAAPPLASGVYRLSAEGDGLIAKMAAWIVKITLISEA